MLNCNLTNEEEQCIDNILSNGLAEIKDLTLVDSHSSGRNTNSISNQLKVGDLKKKYSIDNDNIKISETEFKTKKSNQPKSMALRALINQLKENVDYGFKSDEDIVPTEDNQITMENINCPKREQRTVCNNPAIKKENTLNIDRMEKNSRTFLEMKDEMMNIQNKIEKLNTKISRSVNPTHRNNFHDGKNERFAKKNNEFNKNKGVKIKKKNNIYQKKYNTSVSSLNNSFSNSNIKTKYSTVSNYKKMYDELKEKCDFQKEKIAAEEALVKSIKIKIKQITKKNNNYNKLVECNKKLFSQEELLKKQIIESENIRKEQSKLIRSLQREIDMFRGENEMSSYSNMAEIYQQMKESLLKPNDSQS